MNIKVLVISDSMGSTGPILTAIDREKPDVIIYLGNGIRDLVDINFAGKIYAVRSGGEFGKKLPTAGKISYQQEIILYTHADGYKMPKDKEKLVQFATSQGATMLLFGNNEEPTYFEQNGIKFVCPGSMYDRATASYAILSLFPDKEPKIEHKKLMEC